MSPKNAKYDKVWKDDIRYNKKKGCFSIPTKGMGILLRKLPGIEHLPPELKKFFQEQKLQERVWEEEDAAIGQEYQNEPAPRSRVAGGDAAADGELEDSWVNATDLQRCETPPSMPPLIWQREALQGDVSNQLLSELEREIPAPEQEARKGAPSVARRGPDVGNGLRRGTDGRSGLRKKVIVSNCTQGKLKVEKSGSKVKLVDLSVDRSGHVRVQCGAAH
jgi:hypothetical protein